MFVYIYIYMAVASFAACRRDPKGGLAKESTVDFRNFIVLFWAETLAH